jgi:hypothetical protein
VAGEWAVAVSTRGDNFAAMPFFSSWHKADIQQHSTDVRYCRVAEQCPLLEVKRTSRGANLMSAFNPKRIHYPPHSIATTIVSISRMIRAARRLRHPVTMPSGCWQTSHGQFILRQLLRAVTR